MAGKTYNFNGLVEAKMNKNVVAIIKSLFAYLSQQLWANGIWPGSGWRTGSSEHQSGRAVDIMISPKVNQRPTPAQYDAAMKLVALLIKFGKVLGIQWILFSKDGVVTWSYNLDRGSWNKLGNRGSISANHIDHVHVYFKTTAKLPANFSWGPATAPVPPTTAPKPPSTGGSGSLPIVKLSIVRAQATAKRRTATAAVRNMQKALQKLGFMKSEADGLYGPKTAAAVKAYQKSLGYKGTDADGYIGIASLTALGRASGLFKAAN